ncbi:MAG: hypothetical protein V4713_03580 [Pseudomonadota bacterium]
MNRIDEVTPSLNQAAFLALTPLAIEWIERCSRDILQHGAPLNERDIVMARAVGVQYPEKIRVSLVTQLPLPTDSFLRQAALQAGLLGPNMIGLTLGYGIYICNGFNDHRLLSHECRHVHQYEQAGSIAAYIPKYLQQIAEFGYTNAPYEVDARAHEIHSYA